MGSNRGPYTCVYREIWSEPRFLALTPAGQRVYLYVLTTPLGNGLGCFRAGKAAMAEDLRMSQKAFDEAFAEGLSEAFGEPLFKYDIVTRTILIPKYINSNPSNNPNVLKSLAHAYVQIPDCELKAECYYTVKAFAEGLGEAFAKAFAEAFPKAPGSYIPSPRPSPMPIPDPPIAPQGATVDATQSGFEEFWTTYPRRVGKAAALRKWKATARTRPPLPDLLAAIEAQRHSDQWTREQGQYIPHPATWLSQGRWEDAPVDVSQIETPEQRKAREREEARLAWLALPEEPGRRA